MRITSRTSSTSGEYCPDGASATLKFDCVHNADGSLRNISAQVSDNESHQWLGHFNLAQEGSVSCSVTSKEHFATLTAMFADLLALVADGDSLAESEAE